MTLIALINENKNKLDKMNEKAYIIFILNYVSYYPIKLVMNIKHQVIWLELI